MLTTGRTLGPLFTAIDDDDASQSSTLYFWRTKHRNEYKEEQIEDDFH